ncbi:MAG: FGGY family carbohydrate kinase, partial [Tepidisphaeraceae bacterium]
MACLLGIDIGTSATKTLICDPRGRVLATATAEHPISSPKPGWSEQDPQDWWNATCRATHAALGKARIGGAQVGAIGLSGQMHGSVFLDGKQRVLRPAILWNDQRTADECAEIEAKAGGRRRLIALVANPALTGFTAPKILWLRRREPRHFERTRHILLPKDYVRLRMTGEFATEVSDASGTLLLDVANRRWSRELLRALRIDAQLLPRLHESTDVTGTLSRTGAGALGLTEGT